MKILLTQIHYFDLNLININLLILLCLSHQNLVKGAGGSSSKFPRNRLFSCF